MTVADFTDSYDRGGYCFPVDVLDGNEIEGILSAISSAKVVCRGDETKLNAISQYPHLLLPQVYDLTKNRRVVDAVKKILGEDLLVWGVSLFIKEPHSKKVVSWYQDLTYWDLDNSEETTCWVALTPFTEANGCMKFIPGSQKQRILPHTDTFAKDNTFSRGKEIAVKVDEDDAVNVELTPGQASLHHRHLFHASGPNVSVIPLVAVAIRYINTSMKQSLGERPVVVFASGNDEFGYFDEATPSSGRLADEEFEYCYKDMRKKRKMLFKGVDEDKGQRY